MTMREQVRDAIEWVREDRRENSPETPREWLIYIVEVWAALGLWWRGQLHLILWSAERCRQGHDTSEFHPLDIEWGLTPGVAVEDDALDDEMPAEAEHRIQTVTSLLTIVVMGGFWLSAGVSNGVVLLLTVGPSLAVAVGDPFWGLYADLRTATDGQSGETTSTLEAD